MLQSEPDLFLSALEILRPKPSPYKLIRIGGEGDGAYLLPNDLEEIEYCLSPGVSTITKFETELANKFQIRSDMIDASVSKNNIEILPKFHKFRELFLDIDENEISISLEQWMQEYSHYFGDFILQMDIEGAEYRNVLATSADTLNRFRIIVIELHDLKSIDHPRKFMNQIGATLLKLSDTHICVHASANNCCGQVIEPITGMNIPDVLELTFLRRDRFSKKNKFQPSLPHKLDILENEESRDPILLNEKWDSSQSRTEKDFANQVIPIFRNLWKSKQWKVSPKRCPWQLVTPSLIPDGPYPELGLFSDFVWTSTSFQITTKYFTNAKNLKFEILTPHTGLRLAWQEKDTLSSIEIQASSNYSESSIIEIQLNDINNSNDSIQFSWLSLDGSKVPEKDTSLLLNIWM